MQCFQGGAKVTTTHHFTGSTACGSILKLWVICILGGCSSQLCILCCNVLHILDRSQRLIYHWFPTKTLSAGSGNLVGNQYKAPKRRGYPSHCVRPGSRVAQHLQKPKKKHCIKVIENLRGPFLSKMFTVHPQNLFHHFFGWLTPWHPRFYENHVISAKTGSAGRWLSLPSARWRSWWSWGAGMRKIGAEIQDKLNFTNKISRLKCYDIGVCLDPVVYSNILKSFRWN